MAHGNGLRSGTLRRAVLLEEQHHPPGMSRHGDKRKGKKFFYLGFQVRSGRENVPVVEVNTNNGLDTVQECSPDRIGQQREALLI